MVLDEMPEMQQTTKLGLDFDPVAPLDTFCSGPDFSAVLNETSVLSFEDSLLYEPPEMGLLADPPCLDVACLREDAVPFSISLLNDFASSRLIYAIELMKKAPETMVLENKTPWSHSRLYDDVMPRCLSGMLRMSNVLSMSES